MTTAPEPICVRRVGYIAVAKVIHAESATLRSYPRKSATSGGDNHAAENPGFAESATSIGPICAELATQTPVIHAESATHSYKTLIKLPYRAQM